MKLLTLLGVLLITTGASAYSRDCAKGPEYWCRDISTAEDCGAVAHCQQTVWREKENNQKSMTTSETAEMLCNVLVQASKELLTDGSVGIKSIKQHLRQDCTKLPDQNNLIHQCEMAVDLYLSDILRHIESGTESAKICPIIQGHDTSSAFIPKPKPLGVTSNATCVLCEFIIHLLESAASANASAQELTQILEQICKEMPVVLRDECKSFINTYGADIIALLVKEFDPAKTCHLIKVCPKPFDVTFLTKPNIQTCGLCDYVSTYLTAGYPIENVCNHFSTDNNIKQQCEILVHLYKPNLCSQLPLCFDDAILPPVEQPIEASMASAECSLCKFVISYVDTVIQNNKSEAAIEAALEKVCTILPASLKTKCDEFVVTYGPIIVQLLEKYATPAEVCNAIKACHNGTQESTSLESVEIMKFQKLSLTSVECSLCKYVVGYVEKQLGNNRSAAAVEALLEKVCNVLPAPIKTECTTFVTKYGAIIALLLAKNATAEEVCDYIKVCNNGTQQATSVESVEMMKLKELTLTSVECSLCKYVVGYVEKQLGNNRSAAAVEALLEKVCNVLPAPIKTECTTFVTKYGAIIALLLAKNATAEEVCDYIKVCNNGTQHVTPVESVEIMKFQKLSLTSVECSLCKYVVGYVEKQLGNNRSAAAVEALLEKVCNVLPAPIKTECTTFVTKYGAIIALLLAKNATAEEVCDYIKVCNNGTQHITPQKSDQIFGIKETITNPVECSLCKYVVGYVDAVIQTNKSEAAIDSALEKVCSILPASIKAACVKFVDTYGPVLVELIAKHGTPETVCEAIKACHNGTEAITPVESAQSLKLKELTLKSVECSLCKYVVGYLEKLIGNNRSAAAVEAALEKVCNVFPAPIKTECTTFVTKYGPIIAVLLAKNATGEEVCDYIKVCNNGTQQLTSLESVEMMKLKELTLKSVECSLCKYVLGYLEKLIGNNRSVAAVEAALEKVCNVFPAPIKTECTTFVTKYGPIIAVLLAKNATAEEVCDYIKVCNNGTQQVTSVESVEMMKLKELTLTSVECSLCKYVVGYVEKQLGNNRSAAAVEALLEKVCNVLPAPIKTECNTFVTKYGAIIAVLLGKNATAEEVCDFIKVCNNGTQHVTPVESVEMMKLKELTLKSVECSLCKYVVGYVEKQLGNNRSAAAVEALLEKVCNVLPAPIKTECNTFVTKYGAIIAVLLGKNATAEEVCDFIKVCNNGTQHVTPVESVEMMKLKELTLKSVECSLCKYVLGYLEKLIGNNRSAAAVEAALEKVCNVFPAPIKTECTTFVTKYGPIIAVLLAKNATAEEVCDYIKVCNNGTQQLTPLESVEIMKFQKLSLTSVECSLCKYVVGYVEKQLGNNRSAAAVEALLEKVCNVLPTPIKTECNTFVTKYGAIIAVLLDKNATAEEVCDFIKVCNNGTQHITPQKSDQIFGIKETITNPIECSLCKYVVGYVDAVIQTNTSEAAIDSALEKVCSILPATIKAACIKFVDTYGPILVELIAKHETPEAVCEAIKACHNGTEAITPQNSNYASGIKETITNPIECSLCKYVVGYVDAVIQSNTSEAAIDSALEKVCTILPASVKPACIKFVDTYGPVLLVLIAKHETPEAVCNAIKACHNGTEQVTSNGLAETIEMEEVLDSSAECSLCKFVISYVDTVIQNNKSEAAIEAALEKVCSILPASIKPKCDEFVVNYGPIIVQLLEKYATPAEVCNAIKACHNGTNVAEKVSDDIVKSLKNVNGASECTLCRYVISYLDLLIANNATAQELEKALEAVCSILPAADRSKCTTFVQAYGHVLVELIAELDDPNVVCQWLSLCQKSDDKFIEIPSLKTEKLNSVPCKLCEYLVNYLDAIIQSNSTETHFEEALDRACKILPVTKLQSECTILVNLYGTDLVKFLVEHGDPQTVCKEVGLCDK